MLVNVDSSKMPDELTPPEEQAIQKVLVRMNEQAWGIAFGMLFGGGLFVATLVLVIKGGAVVGPHLSLLGIYFPGYSVSVLGAFIGFVYAFVLGYAVGRTIGTIYNRLVGQQ
jgi:hypothetical protein